MNEGDDIDYLALIKNSAKDVARSKVSNILPDFIAEPLRKAKEKDAVKKSAPAVLLTKDIVANYNLALEHANPSMMLLHKSGLGVVVDGFGGSLNTKFVNSQKDLINGAILSSKDDPNFLNRLHEKLSVIFPTSIKYVSRTGVIEGLANNLNLETTDQVIAILQNTAISFVEGRSKLRVHDPSMPISSKELLTSLSISVCSQNSEPGDEQAAHQILETRHNDALKALDMWAGKAHLSKPNQAAFKEAEKAYDKTREQLKAFNKLVEALKINPTDFTKPSHYLGQLFLNAGPSQVETY